MILSLCQYLNDLCYTKFNLKKRKESVSQGAERIFNT
ncbi:palindromic element RPE5 domain-containing protein [Rickettsia hoogstraalii]|nr:palindromic element RPE5 domain-containing protein [Rickettsia hoogstraalii]MCX4083745.1 palindromic element RPE5 domain-containing protein [Rickettsia hoogstraalii]